MSHDEHLLTRRAYLALEALLDEVPTGMLQEAVATTALAHPEWDMEEKRTLEEWRERSAEEWRDILGVRDDGSGSGTS